MLRHTFRQVGVGLQKVEVAVGNGCSHLHQDAALEPGNTSVEQLRTFCHGFARLIWFEEVVLVQEDHFGILQTVHGQLGRLLKLHGLDVPNDPALGRKHVDVFLALAVDDVAAQQSFAHVDGARAQRFGVLQDVAFGKRVTGQVLRMVKQGGKDAHTGGL